MRDAGGRCRRRQRNAGQQVVDPIYKTSSEDLMKITELTKILGKSCDYGDIQNFRRKSEEKITIATKLSYEKLTTNLPAHEIYRSSEPREQWKCRDRATPQRTTHTHSLTHSSSVAIITMSLASGSHSHAGKPHNGRHATWSRLGEHQSTARALLTNNQRVVFVPPATNLTCHCNQKYFTNDQRL